MRQFGRCRPRRSRGCRHGWNQGRHRRLPGAGAPTAQCGCDECASDQSECVSGYARQCESGSDGCRTWSTRNKCATSACLDSKLCAPTCSDACGPLNTTQCSAGQVRTCTMGSQGCLVWSSYAACASGSCANTTTCNLACTSNCPGERTDPMPERADSHLQPGWQRLPFVGKLLAVREHDLQQHHDLRSGAAGERGVRPQEQRLPVLRVHRLRLDTATAQGNCTVDGTWASSCPAATLAGKCLNQGGSGSAQAVTVWFYMGSPFTTAQLQTACSDTGGTWQ